MEVCHGISEPSDLFDFYNSKKLFLSIRHSVSVLSLIASAYAACLFEEFAMSQFDITEQLENLSKLKAAHMISDDEYDDLRLKLLKKNARALVGAQQLQEVSPPSSGLTDSLNQS